MNKTDTRTKSRSSVLIVNFEHTSHFFLVFKLMILNIYLLTGTKREIWRPPLKSVRAHLQVAVNQKMRKSYFITMYFI